MWLFFDTFKIIVTQKRNKIIIASLVIAVVVVTVSLFARQNPQQLSASIYDAMNHNELRQTIELGVDWFKNAQEDNGHFLYEYQLDTGEYTDDDMVTRQAGSFFQLGEIMLRDEKNRLNLEETMVRSIKYFVDNTVEGTYNNIAFRCVLKTATKCAIGPTALVAIGIVDLIESNPEYEAVYGTLLKDYVQYIVASKLPGKGFLKQYKLGATQQVIEESPFYNGEGLLALVKYYNYQPSDELKELIDETYDYVEEKYTHDPDTSFYLWGMAVVKELYQLEPRQNYVDFVKAFTDVRIDSYQSKKESTRNRCGYLEGITGAYSVLENNVPKSEELAYLEEIDFWLSKTKRLQITEDHELYSHLNEDGKNRALGGFLTGEDILLQRIDFTQHCLNAYLQKLVDIDGGRL